MKKILISVIALAALSGLAVAGERDHDSRLDNPSYVSPSNDKASSTVFILNQYAVGNDLTSAEWRRLEEKNGSKG